MKKLDKGRKVRGLHKGSFTDSLHELLSHLNSEEVNGAAIVFSREPPDGPKKIVRNFFGDPIACRGLLKYADDFIADYDYSESSWDD